MLPIEQSCYWLASNAPPPGSAAPIERTCDIAIVGAGLTGLWTSLFLKQISPASHVTVLEAERPAYGASGRNAGMLSETIDHSHHLAIRHFGFDEARRLAVLGQLNVDRMVAWLREHKVECDLELTGRLVVALNGQQLQDLADSVSTAASVGITTHRLLDQKEVRKQLDSPLYQGGVHISGGGTLDPVKLVNGLSRVAENEGVAIREHARVERITRSGEGVTLTLAPVPGNPAPESIHARRVVLATNAYSHHLFPQLLRRFIPLYDYILVSEPVKARQLDSIGWRGRQGVTDGRTFFNYYRLTRDNRILWGTSEAVYYRNNEVSSARDHSAPHYRELNRSFHRHFPQFGRLEFPYRWGGPIAATTRMTPFFGTLLDGRVAYGLGYTGNGLGNSHLAGQVLAHLVLQRPHQLEDLKLVATPPFPYPPEPVRGMVVGAVTRGLRRVDAGRQPSLLLRLLDRLGIGFSS